MTFEYFMNEMTKQASYRKIAKLADLSPSTIMRIHKKEVKPNYETVKLIAECFGYTVEIVKKEGF